MTEFSFQCENLFHYFTDNLCMLLSGFRKTLRHEKYNTFIEIREESLCSIMLLAVMEVAEWRLIAAVFCWHQFKLHC